MARRRSSKNTPSSKSSLPVVVPPSSNRLSKRWQQSLLPYQREIFLKSQGLDQVALYMEQGTGKTHTTLALLERWLAGDTDPILIVAPLTACELIWRPVLDQLGHPYVLTHPEGLAKLESQICKAKWSACVVDEAHQYKNPHPCALDQAGAIQSSRVVTASVVHLSAALAQSCRRSSFA